MCMAVVRNRACRGKRVDECGASHGVVCAVSPARAPSLLHSQLQPMQPSFLSFLPTDCAPCPLPCSPGA